MFIKVVDHPEIPEFSRNRGFIAGMEKIKRNCEILYHESNGMVHAWKVFDRYLIVYDPLYDSCGIWGLSNKGNLLPRGFFMLDKNEDGDTIIRGNYFRHLRDNRYLNSVEQMRDYMRRVVPCSRKRWIPKNEDVSWDYGI